MHIYKLPSLHSILRDIFEKQKRHEKWEGMDVEMKRNQVRKRGEREREAQESNLECLHEFGLLLSSAAPSLSISLASVSIPSFESAAACI